MRKKNPSLPPLFMKRIVYRSGLPIDGVKCSKCRRKRDGIVMQNRARWVVYLKCGHLAMRGSVLPPSALQDMKLINQKQSEDPRGRALAQFNADERRKQEMDRIKREMAMLNRTRQRYI